MTWKMVPAVTEVCAPQDEHSAETPRRAMLFSHRNGDRGSLPANANALNTPRKAPPWRIAPPTEANPADNLPQAKTLSLVWT